jgi:hypothetical protein
LKEAIAEGISRLTAIKRELGSERLHKEKFNKKISEAMLPSREVTELMNSGLEKWFLRRCTYTESDYGDTRYFRYEAFKPKDDPWLQYAESFECCGGYSELYIPPEVLDFRYN